MHLPGRRRVFRAIPRRVLLPLSRRTRNDDCKYHRFVAERFEARQQKRGGRVDTRFIDISRAEDSIEHEGEEVKFEY